MSVFDFLTHGGMANIGGDLPESDRRQIDNDIRLFASTVNNLGRSLQVPASLLTIKQSSYLLVGKDNEKIHIIFAKSVGSNQLYYRNFTSNGSIPLQALVHQVRIDIGDVLWAFSIPHFASEEEKKNIINDMSAQYVDSVLQAQTRPQKQPAEESINNPEIASGLEKIRKDYPVGKRIVFIIMKFGSTSVHQQMIKDIKDVLAKHNIVGLRADDKEYMDDLFLNVKVYMHTCDFAIAVYERIVSDDFNPNVSLEVGYLFGMKKPVMLLKDQTLKALNTDLTGKLYKEFDTTNTKNSINMAIEKWLSDKGYI
jgi:hypothetical protein